MNATALPPTVPKLLTEPQLAELWQCSVRHLANLRLAGLPFLQIGASVRYDLTEVTDYLRTNRRFAAHVSRQKRRAALATTTPAGSLS
jgi:phage terminase Nu1 subunit (DNA packaging protein)